MSVDNETKAIAGSASAGLEWKNPDDGKFPLALTKDPIAQTWLDAGFSLAKISNKKIIVPVLREDKTQWLVTIMYLSGPHSIVKVSEQKKDTDYSSDK